MSNTVQLTNSCMSSGTCGPSMLSSFLLYFFLICSNLALYFLVSVSFLVFSIAFRLAMVCLYGLEFLTSLLPISLLIFAFLELNSRRLLCSSASFTFIGSFTILSLIFLIFLSFSLNLLDLKQRLRLKLYSSISARPIPSLIIAFRRLILATLSAKFFQSFTATLLSFPRNMLLL